MAVAIVYTKKGFTGDQMTEIHLFSPVKENGGKEHYTLDPILIGGIHPMRDVTAVEVADDHDFLILDYGRLLSRRTMLWLAEKIMVNRAHEITKPALQMQLLKEASDEYHVDARSHIRIDSNVDTFGPIWREVKLFIHALERMYRTVSTYNTLHREDDVEVPDIRVTSTLFMARYGAPVERRLHAMGERPHHEIVIGSDLSVG